MFLISSLLYGSYISKNREDHDYAPTMNLLGAFIGDLRRNDVRQKIGQSTFVCEDINIIFCSDLHKISLIIY